MVDLVKRYSLCLGLILLFMGLVAIRPAAAVGCGDADLSEAAYNRLSQGLAVSQVLAILRCDYTTSPERQQSQGVMTQDYQWASANRSITVTFRLGTLFTKSRGGVTSDNASFSTSSNILSLPLLSLDGNTNFFNARVRLIPGGGWSYLGADSTASGSASSIAATYAATSGVLLIPSVNADGTLYNQVWVHLLQGMPWSILGVGALTQPPLPGAVPATPSITLALTDPATGQARSTVASGNPARLAATLRNASGAAIPGAVVTFATDNAYGTFTPAAGTALTDANGVATITLNASGTASGAATITASAQVSGSPVTGTISYAVGVTDITLGTMTFGAAPLSAYGTTSVNVTVLNNGAVYATSVPVAFTSACAASGKAFLTASVATVSGVATASYRDNGCNGTDTVTATLASGVSSSGNLVVTTPAAGSIQFVSASPSAIALKGTGGTGRQETAAITFRVVDNNNNPVGGKSVTFSLSTTLGGVTLSSFSAVSDPATGNVVTNVIAGTMSTSVRVIATIDALSTQSDQLAISTGLPAQGNFSLSASTTNIEGWNYDGTKTTLTARLADHFHNPVPDGTAVYFTSEGASVAPSCVTTGGACSVEFTSQAFRPSNGRVTVMARAIGEEGFVDLNSNGVVDDATEMIDADGNSTDIGEAYVDYNENGTRDASEPYFDFNGNGAYDAPDGKYSGLLCRSGAAICSASKFIDVRSSKVIVLSSSRANITINGGATIALPTCTAAGVGAPLTFTVTVVDANGNAMPAGSTINFTSDNGKITTANYTVENSSGCRTAGYAGCPAAAGSATFGNYPVTMQSDVEWDATTGSCAVNLKNNGSFKVTVTTPNQEVEEKSMTVTD